MTAPGGGGLHAEFEQIRAAASMFRAGATDFGEVDGGAVDDGIAAAFPGGSATAQAVADVASAIGRMGAALSDRSNALAEAGAAALGHLETTEETFAQTLSTVVPR